MRQPLRVLWVVFYVFVLPFLIACSSGLQEPIEHFELQTPKPFGYVIGDEIQHRLIVDVRPGLALSEDSIPTLGAVNRWLELKSIKTSDMSRDGMKRISIELTYQVFYAALEVKMLKIPGFTLRFRQYDKTVEQRVPDWHFTLSPLHELAIRKDDGQVYLRPDAEPNLYNIQPCLERLSLGFFAVLTCGLYLAYRHGILPWQSSRKHFKRAARDLENLSPSEIAVALSIFHQALNTFNGMPLFKQDLHGFYLSKPQFQTISSELDWFFSFSGLYFYSGRRAVTELDFERLKHLCKRCHHLERVMS